MVLIFSGLWATVRSSQPSRYQPTSATPQDYKKTANYGSVCLDEPNLTREYNEEQRMWDLMKSWLPYLAIYAGMAVIAYSYVFEHWSIVDSIYFAVATFTTVGYGNLEPSTVPGQLFTIFFAIYGIIILGVFIGIFGHSVSVAQERTVKNLQKKDQSRLLRMLFTDYSSQRKVKADTQALKENFITDHQMLFEGIKQVCWEEYPQIMVVMLLATILGYREGWTITSTLYFSIMSASTTGFGDYTPTTEVNKIYCIFFFPISVAVFGEVLGKIAGIYVQHKFRKNEQNFLKRTITLCDLNRMDADSNGEVELGEFLSFMLVALQKVDQESIDELVSLFKSLDSNGNGVLDKADIIELAESSPLCDLQVEIAAAEAAEEEANSSAHFELPT